MLNIEYFKKNKHYLQVTFNELCCFNSSLHIKADVHLHFSFMVCQLDDRHLGQKKPTIQS